MVQLIREVSQALFAAPYRMEILLTVAAMGDEPLRAGTVHKRLLDRIGDVDDVPDKTTVTRTLSSLRAAGLVGPADKQGNCDRIDSSFWVLLVDYGDELERRFAPATLGVAR